MNDLELLRPSAVFATVVEEGSFRGAADRLGLSAPYVSQLVADLETRLGRQLLYRSTRRLTLSSDGERYLAVAQQIADALSEELTTFRAEIEGLVGQLRLSVPTILAAPFFAQLVTEFQLDNPKLEMTIMMEDQPVDPLDHQIDLVIRIGDPGKDPRPARKLFETIGIVCTSADLADKIETPNDLMRYRWVKTPAMQKDIKLLSAASRASKVVTGNFVLTTNNGQLTSRLIAENAGWAIFPEFSVRKALNAGDLVRVLPDWHLPAVGVFGLYSARRTSLSNAKTFLDFVVSKLGPYRTSGNEVVTTSS